MFAVDFIFPGTTPPVWGEYDWTPLREWIAVDQDRRSARFRYPHLRVTAGGWGPEADVVANREFLQDLSAAVSKGIAEGKSLDELIDKL